MKFLNIYKETEERMRLALLSLWAPGRHPMRPAIEELFKREPLMAEPVFQGTFGWKKTPNDNWRNFLNTQIIERLDIGRHTPYIHQAESWRSLKEGNSIVVTSGTGSGKTECFMYPVISDLFEQERDNSIQALFLYPLNALMKDQKRRLSAYCVQSGLRFAVYNGDTKESRTPNDLMDGEVGTRDAIRDNNRNGTRPQILLTNPSMLEYIMVRNTDQAMIQQSAGRLRWIVIDEAHTYSGSAAVELSYQIKRILDAFQVNADDVRFACTSATIGGENEENTLAQFIASITGQDINNIRVIGGSREIPPLDEETLARQLTERGLPPVERVIQLREIMNNSPGMSLHEIWNMLREGVEYDIETALTLLDDLCELDQDGNAVLSLRAHFFMRSVNGLYACGNDNCLGSPYGSLTTYKSSSICSNCRSPLLEIVQCKCCNNFLLMGISNAQTHQITPSDDTYNYDNYFTIDNNEDEDEDELARGDHSPLFFLQPYQRETYYNPLNGSNIGLWKIVHRNNISLLIPDLQELNLNQYNGINATDVALNTTWIELKRRDRSYCPSCGKLAIGRRLKLKKFRIPISFISQTIAPVFLKESAQEGYYWGKYIAFTDSRQGTAISAMRLNINIERMRSWEEAIRFLIARQNVRDQLRQNNPDIFQASAPASATLHEIADAIFDGTLFDHINRRETTHKDAYKAALIRLLIGRRPLFEVNVEGLGLLTLTYPNLRNVTMPDALREFARERNLGITDQDWQDYLKIVLDYFVRAGNHIQPRVDNEDRYIREENNSCPFAGPDDNRSECPHWPVLKINNNGQVEAKQSRIILILCAGLGIHTLATLQNYKDTVDALISEAWFTLRDNMLTQVIGEDIQGYNHYVYNNRYVGCYFLDLSNREGNNTASLSLTQRIFVCPVTGSKFDTTFKGYSPLLTGELSTNEGLFAKYQCGDPIDMPIRPYNHNNVVAWLQNDARVLGLKEQGLWNDRYGDIYECKPTYLAAEHSAQQPNTRLGQYIDEFNQNRINILQCSTTMEMGVDIGDIDIVLMQTIPPTAANYLQRVGRAGRMGQRRSIAFSLCNNTPIGQYAFSNPMWALEKANHMINVLESNTIIQRHINSYFFRRFICREIEGIQAIMSVDDFMGEVCDRFINYLDEICVNEHEKQSFHNIFGEHSFTIDITRNQITSIRDGYRNVIGELNTAFDAFEGDERRIRAIAFQINRCKQENLIKYLSENQFIPNANMPTGVVSFNFMDRDQSENLQRCYRKRDKLLGDLNNNDMPNDQRIRYQDQLNEIRANIDKLNSSTSASRDIRTALNEYAPEQTVVVDERNFISAGILLLGAYNERTQSKAIYHCPQCGRIEYSNILDENRLCNCGQRYRSIINPNANLSYTRAYEPVGFCTDQNIYARRVERSEKKFYDIRPLLLDINWDTCNHVNFCDVVSSGDNGQILFYNVGVGYGFAFCKRCGRASIENGEHDIPHAVRPGHHHLWNDNNNTCNATNNDIARNIVFTGSHYTCYSVLRFYADHETLENDEELVYSLGVILTRTLAKSVGVDESEVDFGVKQERTGWLLFIYDTAKGGCGYSLMFNEPVACQEIFDIARADLENSPCRCHEDRGACTSCLLDRNNYRFVNKLSKAKALNWLTKQNRQIVQVPAEVLDNWPNATIIYQSLKRIFSQACRNRDMTDITVVVSDKNSNIVVSDWVSNRSEMGRNILRAIELGINVRLLVEYHPEFHEDGDILQFFGLQDKFPDCTVQFISDLGFIKTALMTQTNDGVQRRYFVIEEDALVFSNHWGEPATRVFTDGESCDFDFQIAPIYTPTPLEIIREGVANVDRLNIGNYFSAVIRSFVLQPDDDQLLNAILNGKNVSITFSDMYVNSALASLMFTYLIKEMKDIYGFIVTDITLQFYSRRRRCENIRFDKYFTRISQNWQTEAEADGYTKSLIQTVLEVDPQFSNDDANHHRWIRLMTENGNIIEIRPDHGISGGWTCGKRYIDLDRNQVNGNTMVTRTDDQVVFYFIIKTAP